MSDKTSRSQRKLALQAYAELGTDVVEELLDQLCVGYGFCLKPKDKNLLIMSPPTDVIAFTQAILTAEGSDPDRARVDLFHDVNEVVYRAFVRARLG